MTKRACGCQLTLNVKVGKYALVNEPKNPEGLFELLGPFRGMGWAFSGIFRGGAPPPVFMYVRMCNRHLE